MPSPEIRQIALKFLARREYSQAELISKLQTKGFLKAEIQAELDLLQEGGLQSDSRFCEAFIRERIRMGYGPRAIEALLMGRGLTGTLIDQFMSVYSEAFWQEHLRVLWQRRFSAQDSKDPQSLLREKARQYRFLTYRGFDSQAIYALLKQVDYEQ